LRYRSAARFSRDNSFNTVYAGGYIPVSRKEVPGFSFDIFNWHGFSFYNNQILIRGTTSLAFDETVVVGYATTQKEMSVAENDMAAGAVEEVMTVGDAAAAPPPPAPEVESLPQVRRNFSETAFFYPQLRTNEKGETQIAFTVPESNTRWRFRLLAHDRELSSGSAEAFTLSQKELMVTPSMPRFLREGDHATISSKISNLSDSLLKGEVRLQLFNPLTEELISDIRIDDAVMPFTLAAGTSTEVAWSFALPTGI
ncbi:MAG: alpha-2-macroglobulin family protein, partial [Proteiniphilum sp.]|nr:alpha-2-macroglobulin family protein [Proteiniphilum sp.]